jgi:hypothetical protein
VRLARDAAPPREGCPYRRGEADHDGRDAVPDAFRDPSVAEEPRGIHCKGAVRREAAHETGADEQAKGAAHAFVAPAPRDRLEKQAEQERSGHVDRERRQRQLPRGGHDE